MQSSLLVIYSLLQFTQRFLHVLYMNYMIIHTQVSIRSGHSVIHPTVLYRLSSQSRKRENLCQRSSLWSACNFFLLLL